MPKKPVSSFLLYAKTLDRGEASVIDFIKGASQKWKVLPVQEKEKYEAEAKEANLKYTNDLKEWNVKMLTMGKNDLVSKTFISNVMKNITSKKNSKKGKKKAIDGNSKKTK